MYNSLCASCALLGKDCTGTTNQSWTGCIHRTNPDGAYTAKIAGKWYAFQMDTFGHYVFGTGADAGKLARVERTPGTTEGRNAAILATCSPLPTWRDAYNAARESGHFVGQLYER